MTIIIIEMRKNCLPLCLSTIFEGNNLSSANMPDFSQSFSITVSDPGYSGLIITFLNFCNTNFLQLFLSDIHRTAEHGEI